MKEVQVSKLQTELEQRERLIYLMAPQVAQVSDNVRYS